MSRQLYRMKLMFVMHMLEDILMMLKMDNVHWIAWEIRLLRKTRFPETELKKLANSEIIAISKITPVDFADSEPGATFFCFFRKLLVRLKGP
jgi:hypothetical protein